MIPRAAAGHAAIWGPPGAIAILVAFVFDAGDKHIWLVLLGTVLALPYLAAAGVAWRRWRSPAAALLSGIFGAAIAYGALVALLVLAGK